MSHAALTLFAFFWLLCLSACAPVILGRTPTPAALGETEVSVSGGYLVGLTDAPPDNTGLFGPAPAYWPLPLPIGFSVAYGRSETLETNFGLTVAPGFAGAVDTGQPNPMAVSTSGRATALRAGSRRSR